MPDRHPSRHLRSVDTPVHAMMAEAFAQAMEEFHRTEYGKAAVDLIIEQIQYRDGYWIETGVVNGQVWLEVVHERPDADTEEMGYGRGGRRYIPVTATASDIVRLAFGACLAYEEHEVREFFRFQGERVFGPHMNLVELAEHLRG